MADRSYFYKRVVVMIFVFGFAIVRWNICMAQENSEGEAEQSFNRDHKLALILSHAHVFEGRDIDGKRKTLSLPAWGIDYTFTFCRRWAVGLHTDLVIEKFKVEKNLGNKEVVERNYPVAPAIMAIYKPTPRWNFLLGMGAEFASEENFILTRIGVEYAIELPKRWETFGTFGYDFRWDAYDTWTIGIGVAKVFGEQQ